MALLGKGPWAMITAIVLLVCLELAARRYFNPTHVSEETYSKYYPAYDYGFEQDPVCWRSGEDRVCQPTPYLDVVRQTFPARKAKNERLVFMIGSSVSRADGVRAYSNALENDLRRERLEARVRVVNLSASSTGSTRQLVRVREALAYAPDLLLIHLHPGNEAKDERDFKYSSELHRGLGGMALRSHAVVALKKYYAESTEMEVPAYGARDAATTTEIDESDEAWALRERLMEQNLDAMLRLAAAARVPVVLLGTTRNVRGFVTERLAHVNDGLLARASDGVQYFDTREALRRGAEKVDPPPRLFQDRVHYTRHGHKIIADALVPLVRKALRL